MLQRCADGRDISAERGLWLAGAAAGQRADVLLLAAVSGARESSAELQARLSSARCLAPTPNSLLLASLRCNLAAFPSSPRRLVAPCVLIYEYMAYNRVADVGVRASVGIIVIGAIVAGWDTLNDDLFGYTLTVINNLLTAASSVMVRYHRGAAAV